MVVLVAVVVEMEHILVELEILRQLLHHRVAMAVMALEQTCLAAAAVELVRLVQMEAEVMEVLEVQEQHLVFLGEA
jgi:hypothetical protein